MKATVEPLEGNKVKLSVEVDEGEFEDAINAAFKKIAREVRIPGFRPGKAPRRILEARLGKDIARSQALQDALPEYYARAIRENDVDVIAAPSIDITGGEEDGDVAFDAVVEIRPTVSVGGYNSLRVTIPSPVPTDEEIDAQIDRLRTQFGELETVDRPIIADDYATVDIAGSQGGEPLEGLTADDYLYQVGSGAIVRSSTSNCWAPSRATSSSSTRSMPGDDDAEPLDFRVLVKEVKERKLPTSTTSSRAEASEFETLDELRDDLHKRMQQVKQVRANMALREKVGEALADLIEDDIPDALVNGEMQERLNDLAMRLQAPGMTLEQWLTVPDGRKRTCSANCAKQRQPRPRSIWHFVPSPTPKRSTPTTTTSIRRSRSRPSGSSSKPRRCVPTSNALTRSRRYAPTSRSARRSIGSSRRSRSSMTTAT